MNLESPWIQNHFWQRASELREFEEGEKAWKDFRTSRFARICNIKFSRWLQSFKRVAKASEKLARSKINKKSV